jgi:predicted DNA-binding transcriptional regulator AlpA
VLKETGLSQSALYRLIQSGDFPKSFPLTSKNCVAWLASEVESWKQARLEAAGKSGRSHKTIPDMQSRAGASGAVCERNPLPVRTKISSRNSGVS